MTPVLQITTETWDFETGGLGPNYKVQLGLIPLSHPEGRLDRGSSCRPPPRVLHMAQGQHPGLSEHTDHQLYSKTDNDLVLLTAPAGTCPLVSPLLVSWVPESPLQASQSSTSVRLDLCLLSCNSLSGAEEPLSDGLCPLPALFFWPQPTSALSELSEGLCSAPAYL